jgi:hypothetical protein
MAVEMLPNVRSNIHGGGKCILHTMNLALFRSDRASMKRWPAYPGVRRKCHDDLWCSSTIEVGNIWGSHLVLRSLQFEEVEGQHPTRVALLTQQRESA